MTNMTLAIPEELANRMRKFREMRWSEVARQAIERRVDDMEAIEKIASKSKLTMKDIEEIGHKIKKGISSRIRDESRSRH
jgi:hypothetical protein